MLETAVIQVEGGITVIDLKGRLTLGSRLSQFEAEVATLARNGATKIILDLSGIEYADSSALGVLLHASGAVRAKGGRMLLAGPNQRLQELFKLTNTTELLPSYPDRADCITHLL